MLRRAECANSHFIFVENDALTSIGEALGCGHARAISWLERYNMNSVHAEHSVIKSPQVAARTAKKETILLVEDEAFLRGAATEVLQAAGYKVLATKSAAEALVAFREHRTPIQILVTDVCLRGKSGIVLANRMKDIWPFLAVIFISGYARKLIDAGSAVVSGASCLAKPFSAAELVEAIKKVKKFADGEL